MDYSLPVNGVILASGSLAKDYFRLRDCEYVQPLYDLAFLLEVSALAEGTEV